jgi:mono/diheme cytochrome c family protein
MRQLSNRTTRTLFIVTMAMWLVSGIGSFALASPQAIAAGQEQFNRYCSACHGTDAKGTGPLAELLKNGAPDLTMIYKKYKGVFPFSMVVDVVEGQALPKAHGGREMPVWGTAFRDDEGDSRSARGRILDIVLYLDSIQSK